MARWTRLVRFIAREDGREHYGQPVDQDLDVGIAVYEGKDVITHEVTGDRLLFDGEVDPSSKLTIDRLLSPVPAIPGSIRCLGVNFRKHVEEAGQKMPIEPVVFMKPHTSLAGPGEVLVPKFVHKAESFDGKTRQLDYETELAFVVSSDAKNISPEQAYDYVLGPVLVSPSVIIDPSDIAFVGKLNGEVRQQDSTKDWIFSITDALSFLSQGTTVPAGTVVLMGTPSGIG
ncbi:hypothetical protein OIO90_000006 [Microbotryomycetes sp. JL221]|nr:hypothetical protein OIO90_000006 [Microbotryomycetes sp. JL221]